MHHGYAFCSILLSFRKIFLRMVFSVVCKRGNIRNNNRYDSRFIPLATILTLREPHSPQTSQARQSGTVVLALDQA